MKLNICGPSYKHPAIEANYQRCVNMFPVVSGPEGRGKATLLPTAGLELLTNLGGDPVRCMGTVGIYTYVVLGSSVYRLEIDQTDGTLTSSSNIGTMTSTSGIVKMAANPTQIIWVDGTANGYIYTPGSGVFQEITATDADFPGGSDVKFINGYFVVSKPNDDTFYFSALNNGLNWDPLDVATAETNTDNLVGLGVSKGELWAIGAQSTEIWYDAANPTGAPFSLRTGLQIQIGCSAPHSIVNVNDLLTWLDHRGFIVQSSVSPFVRSNNSGYDLQIISDEALTAEILTYETISDAIAMTYNDRGHIMYQITFPTERKTWVYDYTTQSWHERSYHISATGEDVEHLAQFYAQIGTYHIMSGLRDGKVYLSSSEIYEDNGDSIIRIRTTPLQHDAEQFSYAGVSRLEVRIGTKQHQVSNPQVTLRYSHDGGHTWSNEMARDIGESGEYGKSITWNRLGSGREWIFEFKITDAIPFAIIDAMVIPTELEG